MKKSVTLLLLFSVLSMMKLSAQTITGTVVSKGLTLNYSISGGEATITGTPDKTRNADNEYDLHNGGIVDIPAHIIVGSNTYPVTAIASNAFSDCEITSLTLPSTLKTIRERAFAYNTGSVSYDELVIPASVQRIENNAFINHRIKHLSFAPNSQLSFFGRLAFATYRPASKNWDGTFYPSSEYNIEYYDFSNTQLKAAYFDMAPNGQQFFHYLRLSGRILIFLPSTFDVYPCANLNYMGQGGSLNIVANEINIVRTDAQGNRTCDNLLVSDDMSFRTPHQFTAKKATCNRTFSNTAGKAVSTLYLPYPTDLPTGMQAYTLTKKGVDVHGDKAFCFVSVPLGTRLEANRPYLVHISDGNSHTLPEMQNVIVPVTPDIEDAAVEASNDSDWKFYGTSEYITNSDAFSKSAYYLSGNRWWAVQNGVANDHIAPFRCFIASPTNAAPARSFFMVLDNDTTTDIRALENETQTDIHTGSHTFYSIDGKYMGKDYDALLRGQIYVVNGKKFYKF